MTNSNSTNRLSTAFHESFSLSRLQLSQTLESLDKADDFMDLNSASVRQEYLHSTTHLGTNQAKAVPNYARGSGLIDDNYHLTAFGRKVLTRDKLLESRSTQWLMHYHLCAPHGPGPEFWNILVTTRFLIGEEFTADGITKQIVEIASRLLGKKISDRTAKSTATIFLGSYTKNDGLAALGILQIVQEDHYIVLEPEPSPVWVFGFALLDYWKAHFGDRLTVNLQDLIDGLADLFFIGAGRVNRYLGQLQTEGYVDIFRAAPPFQVVLLRQDPNPLLEKIYEF